MVEEPLGWIQQDLDQIDIKQAAEQLGTLMDLIGGLVFEVALQLTAQALVAAL